MIIREDSYGGTSSNNILIRREDKSETNPSNEVIDFLE
jgi:hypothetical protein